MYNCPNTETYRVNDFYWHNFFRIRTIVHCVTNLSWFCNQTSYLMFSILGQWIYHDFESIQPCISSFSFPWDMEFVTLQTGTAYPYGEHEFTPLFSGIRVAQSLVFSAMFCKSLFFHLSVILRFMASNYPYGIFKLSIQTIWFFKWFHGAMVFHQYYI